MRQATLQFCIHEVCRLRPLYALYRGPDWEDVSTEINRLGGGSISLGTLGPTHAFTLYVAIDSNDVDMLECQAVAASDDH